MGGTWRKMFENPWHTFRRCLMAYDDTFTSSLDVDKWPIFSLLEPEFLRSIRLFCVFSNGNEAILVTKDDDVYAMGTNSSGCLGLGTLCPQCTYPPLRIPCNTLGIDHVQCAC